MKFTEDFIQYLGENIEDHIYNRLKTVISADRIKVKKDFYHDSLKEKMNLRAALVHIDCDLYQSTVEVLDYLATHDLFEDGCILLFDDWNCFKGNPNFGERRALKEFLEKHKKKYSSSFFENYSHNGAAYMLHKV
jgi:O-methyltransferase